jgi:cytochrome c oxidase cbb3-type subunit 4
MNPIWGQVAGAFILAMMITFIGIWVWAWRKHHQGTFDQMALLPTQEDFDEHHAGSPADTQEYRP